MRCVAAVLLLVLTGCAALTTIRCPSEPLTNAEIAHIRQIQSALAWWEQPELGARLARGEKPPPRPRGDGGTETDRRIAAYLNMCGAIDPVTHERVLRE